MYHAVMALVEDASQAPNAHASKIDHARIPQEVDAGRHPAPEGKLSKVVGGLMISSNYAASCHAPSGDATGLCLMTVLR